MRPPRRNSEGGYALLVVLLIGAIMAIMMYMSLPRAAFEAQRDKEDDLMYRGGQYARAIRLYFRKNKRYPGSMDDLEKPANNIHFLRKKYVDPITKKDEWRVIHVGPAGTFTDSLVYDQPKKKDKEGESGAASAQPGPGLPGTPGTPGSDPQQVTGMADRLRANPGGQPNPNDPNAPPGFPAASYPGMPQPGQPGAPAQTVYFNPGYPGAAPGVPGQPGQPNQPAPGIYPVAPGVYPGSTQPMPNTPGFSIGGGMGQNPGGMQGTRPGTMVMGGMFGGQAGGFGSNQPGGFGGAQPNQPMGASGIGTPPPGSQAAQIIQQLLTTPRPGGLAGLPGAAAGANFSMGGTIGAQAGQSTFGGGIAGVASKSEARGIKVYNERETYNEWEFVYDFRRDPLMMGGAAGGIMPGQTGMMPGQQPPNTGGGLFGPSSSGTQGGQPPVTPINPMQPGLTRSPFGQPR